MKITKFTKITALIIASLIGFSTLSTVPTFATTDVCSTDAPADVKEAAGCNGNKNALPTIIQSILNAIILVAGIISAVYIVIGGIHYITSNGDAAKVKKAKDTILYALIGLIVCALAFALVNWVILVALK